jgi:hypothetical protein
MAKEYMLECNDCKKFAEGYYSPDNKEPCPFCGSKNTIIGVIARGTVSCGVHVEGKATFSIDDAPSILLQYFVIPIGKTAE